MGSSLWCAGSMRKLPVCMPLYHSVHSTYEAHHALLYEYRIRGPSPTSRPCNA